MEGNILNEMERTGHGNHGSVTSSEPAAEDRYTELRRCALTGAGARAGRPAPARDRRQPHIATFAGRPWWSVPARSPPWRQATPPPDLRADHATALRPVAPRLHPEDRRFEPPAEIRRRARTAAPSGHTMRAAATGEGF